ncbi:MAG TPA: hypothetical protein DCL61_23165 [Cyanobacteria bacterium UBA12227]|nr:hypothetical protein [Cyanobacteria bacterium UBA12227]HAX87743.1 hypothetical protein [Cyanobacteria bacterium UBA11370]HBY80901.1 hypothetical protein [Cyanobacteria bacterium UBA11148]
MYYIKTMTRNQLVITTISVIASLITYPLPSQAQVSDQPNNSRSESIPIRFILANPPLPDNGTPETKRGTGTRGDCLSKTEQPPLTYLGGENNFELTVSERPTVWVYVPYTSKEAPSGEFSLQDGEEDVYRTQFQLPATPGIVSITLPATKKPLEVGKTYRWYFDINCPASNSISQPTPASITGVIQRISPSIELENELKTAKTPLEEIAAYAKHSIWHETVTELAQLRLNEPENSVINDIWVQLLSDPTIGLNPIAQEPIVGGVITSSPQE